MSRIASVHIVHEVQHACNDAAEEDANGASSGVCSFIARGLETTEPKLANTSDSEGNPQQVFACTAKKVQAFVQTKFQAHKCVPQSKRTTSCNATEQFAKELILTSL